MGQGLVLSATSQLASGDHALVTSGFSNSCFCTSISVRKFVSCFIDFPKPLVALVNGPALGIAVTILGLCDVAYASDKVGRLAEA